jgi:cytochrome c-type biogenesis protein CcmF
MLARPIGILYAFILAFCPLLSWRNTPGATFWSRAKWPFATAAVIFAALIAEWWLVLRPIYDFMVAQGGPLAANFTAFGPSAVYHTLGLLGLFAGAMIIATTIWLFIDGARKRADAKGESFGASLWAIVSKARTQSGGYLAHLGIGIIMIGLVGSAMYVRDVKVLLPEAPGESFSVSNYTFTFQGIESQQLPNGDIDSVANFEVTRDGKSLGTVSPGLTQFARQGQTRLNASVRSELLRDIFMVWEGNQTNEAGETELSINVKINPLIWFAWGGFIMLLLGTTLAAWPRRRVAVEVAPARAKAATR